MQSVAVVGVAQTAYAERRVEDTFADLVFEASTAALADAGATIADVDNVITVSNDFFDGRTISSMAVQHAAGAWHKNTSCVEGDGILGALYGLARITSGSYQTTLVVAHHKGSVGRADLTTNAYFDPIFERSLGLDFVSAAAMQAHAYLRKFGLTEHDLAAVAVKSRMNAARNPHAQVREQVSVADVLASERLADPLKTMDCSPQSDGAAAVLLSSPAGLSRFATPRPVWITGSAFAADSGALGGRDLSTSPALATAASAAYRQAGINDPLAELDVVELADLFSHMELMWTEGLGLCEAGAGARLLQDGITAAGGRLPVNPSGGALSGRPPFGVSGLAAVAEVVTQLRGDAGERQVAEARTGLAHGAHGLLGQSHAVMVLSGEQR